MQDSQYIALMCIVIFILFLCFWYSRRRKSELGRILSAILLTALAIIAFYTPALFCPHPLTAGVFYSLYFIANTWLSMFLALMAWIYTGRKKLNQGAKTFLWGWLILDNAALLSNIWKPWVVTYEYVVKSGTSCWMFHPLLPFYGHLLFCYLLLAVFYGCLIDRLRKSPALYRTQYASMLATLSVCVIGNGIFLLNSDIIDLSVILYAICGILLYYSTFLFLPRRLTQKISQLVIDRMDTALLFYDNDGRCIYVNDAARDWFTAGCATRSLQEFAGQIGFLSVLKEEKQIIHSSRGEEEVYYRAAYQRLEDARHQFLGSFFELDDITAELKVQERRIYQAAHDPLTGIYNRSMFYEEAARTLQNERRENYSILITDIGKFKLFNDLLGQDTCDEMIRVSGRLLQSISRDGIIVGRLESDRFAICAPTVLALEQTLPKQLEEELSRIPAVSSLSLTAAEYCGVYHVDDRSLPISIMCDRAYMALASIKGDAQNRIASYDESIRQTYLNDNAMITALPRALKNREFLLYFQPQFNSEDSSLIGAEALVRWQDPVKGMISPGDFIPLFERCGLIYQLDQYVWEAACAFQKSLLAQGYALPISVNISPSDIYRCDVAQTIIDLVRKYDLPPQYINLELTESALVMDMDRMTGIVAALQQAGFRIEMDDFGSGYSSLNTLKDIQVDVLKLDMKFMENARDPERSLTILHSIADMSHALKLPVIVEGVETRSQVDMLAGIGWHNIQGYYYARPMPFESYLSILKEKAVPEA